MKVNSRGRLRARQTNAMLLHPKGRINTLEVNAVARGPENSLGSSESTFFVLRGGKLRSSNSAKPRVTARFRNSLYVSNRRGSQFPKRISWSPFPSQVLYDQEKPHFKIMKRLWRICSVVRERQGTIQSALEKGNDAVVSVRQVIYCIFSPLSRKLYVGQTFRSCKQRFVQHISDARCSDSEPLHRAIKRLGPRNFFIFPLEKVEDAPSSKTFRAAAHQREKFWIERLHSWAPNGWNVAFSERRRRKRCPRKNPVKKRRLEYQKTKPIEKVESCRCFGYRNIERRCNYVAHCVRENVEEHLHFDRYRRINLRKMLDWLECGGKLNCSSNVRKRVLFLLRDFLLIPKRSVRMPHTFLCFPILWGSSSLNRIPLREVLLQYRHLLPQEMSSRLDNVLIQRILPQPIAHSIFNFRRVARNLKETDPDGDCPCRMLFPEQFRPNNGCVFTGDLSIVRNHGLRTLLSYGPQFRQDNGSDPLVLIRDALFCFVEKWAKVLRINKIQFGPWRASLLEHCRGLLSGFENCHESSVPSLQERTLRKYLRFLHQFLVIVPADKAPSNCVFVCRRLYSSTLRRELQNPQGAYVESGSSIFQITDKHIAFLQQWGFRCKKRLPLLYYLPKMHKQGSRFIAASRNVTTTEPSKIVTSILKCVLGVLREKDEMLFRERGVRRFFVVESAEIVARSLTGWRFTESSRDLQTYDFATMYTKIPLDDLLLRLERVTDEAVNFVSGRRGVGPDSMFFMGDGGNVSLESRGRTLRRTIEQKSHLGGRCWRLSRECFLELLRFAVKNTFVVAGKKVWHQRVGIPMGTNFAPFAANLYLYSYESEYVDRLLSSAVHVGRFRLSFRMIDDILFVNNPEIAEHLPHIYPSFLEVSRTGHGKTVCFLGMKLHVDQNSSRLRVTPYDRRDEFPFSVVRYPHSKSHIPRHIAYGVFTGQLHRLYSLCSHSEDFVVWASHLAHRMATRGWNRVHLQRCFRKFVRCNVRRFSGHGGRLHDFRLFTTRLPNSVSSRKQKPQQWQPRIHQLPPDQGHKRKAQQYQPPHCHHQRDDVGNFHGPIQGSMEIDQSHSSLSCERLHSITVLSGDLMLDDATVNDVQGLLERKFADMSGWQDVALGQTGDFQPVHGAAIQILFDQERNHWLCVTNLFGRVQIYDSLFVTCSSSVLADVAQIFRLFIDNSILNVEIIRAQRQEGVVDCGLFAIANACLLAEGFKPQDFYLFQSRLRAHLTRCLRSTEFSAFPALRDPGHNPERKVLKVRVCKRCFVPLLPKFVHFGRCIRCSRGAL